MQISWVSVTVALSNTFLMFSTIPLTHQHIIIIIITNVLPKALLTIAALG